MSGYKHATVTISQEEYRRLYEADMTKRFKQFSRIKSQDASHNEVVLNLIDQLEERERQLQSALSTLGQNDTANDNHLLQELLNQNSLYYENMVANLRNTNFEFQDAMSSMTDDFARIMQVERESYNQSLQSLIYNQNINQNNEYLKAEAAQTWFNYCLTFVDFIQAQFDHERFTPGRLNRILRNLNIAENNLANDFCEACLQVSQQMYLELSDLNLELEELIFQWQALFEKTYASLNDIIFQMISNGKVKAVGLNGEELPDYVELDYWTNGRFLQLLDHSRQLLANMNQDQNILTSEDLDRIYYQILPVVRETFESLVYEARLNALNSQLRMNIAEKALQALENHGFCLDRSGYSDGDMRSQFNAHLACPDGSEVTINVMPTEKASQELSNELVVITKHPDLKTEHEARIQWEELSQTLAQYNLKVSRPEILTTPASFPSERSGQESRTEQKYTQVER